MMKFDATKKTPGWNPTMEFDPVGFGVDGSVVWKDYGRPRDVAERDRDRNEKRERDAAKRERGVGPDK